MADDRNKPDMELSLEAEAEAAARRNPDTFGIRERIDYRGRVRVFEHASGRYRDLYPIDVREGMKRQPPLFSWHRPDEEPAAPAPEPKPEPKPEPAGIEFRDFTVDELKAMHADAVQQGLEIIPPDTGWRKDDWTAALAAVNYTPTPS